jgi:putative two-component system response regulator
VLIDLVAPAGHGFEVCRALKQQKLTRFVPVVIVTAQNEPGDRLDGINAGADHCQRLAKFATSLGRELALDNTDLAALERGGYLHDVGKIAVPDSVLFKGGKLDAQEYRVIREHPVVGDALCAGLRSLQAVRPVHSHHERLDGSGYPDGLKNAAVPLLAQIVSIVDVFDALTMERPYREARPREEAFDVLSTEASKGWRDRALVDAFITVVSQHPPGRNH